MAKVLIAAILVATGPTGARAQNADDIAALNGQVLHLYELGRYAEVTAMAHQALTLAERTLGPEHPETLTSVNHLGLLYQDQGRYDEAELLYRRVLAGREQIFGSEHPDTLTSVNNLAGIHQAQGRYSEAELLHKRALSGRERVLGPEHPHTLGSVNNLAALYQLQGRYSEAEPLHKRALAGSEQVLGQEHPTTLGNVGNLAYLYWTQGRYLEAEPLYKRALSGLENTLGAGHPRTLTSANDLGLLYQDQGRYDEAELLYGRVLAGREQIFGSEQRDTLTSVNNLAGIYQAQGRYGDAELLHKRALSGRERVLGPEHPHTLGSVNNLAALYQLQGRYNEAEPLHKRALAGSEQVLGREHPTTLRSVGNLGSVYFAKGDWVDATELWSRGTRSIADRSLRGTLDARQAVAEMQKSESGRLSWQFWGLVKAVYRLALQNGVPEVMASREMFRTAQWAQSSEAAQSLAQMTARGAKGDPELAALVRERQDLIAEWQRRDEFRNAWLGQMPDQRNAKAEVENTARLASIDARVLDIDRKFTTTFPDYAALVRPEPLSVDAVQAQLGVDEVLILFLDIDDRFKPTPEETFTWVVTKTEMRWVRSDLGSKSLIREVRALRCGLDEEEWATPTEARRCSDLLGLMEAPDASQPLPFDLGKAHALYQALFGQIEDLIAGKRLLIVPSGALTSLPFHVLVTKAPGTALPDKFDGYRDISWLGKMNAITTLPAVSSLSALRQYASNREPAAGAYVGYGNPLLSGVGAGCPLPKVPDTCPRVEVAEEQADPRAALARAGTINGERATIRGLNGRRSGNANIDDVFSKGTMPGALLQHVRELCPLPDTAYEIQCVAESFKGKALLIRLEGDAKEADIKALSETGQLSRYRILHFATHGLLSGDVERMTKRRGEPALVLTPPDKPADSDDDGLLMASEVAALRLNADWVVLSACNTAAGDRIGAQALSGLARAFFYAGGRTLLVSHWPVYSDAAVRITTRAFFELDRSPTAGRAEALQNSMIDLMDDRSQADNAHPAVWAPFVVVGEGAR